jgi:hypothetical protein
VTYLKLKQEAGRKSEVQQKQLQNLLELCLKGGHIHNIDFRHLQQQIRRAVAHHFETGSSKVQEQHLKPES